MKTFRLFLYKISRNSTAHFWRFFCSLSARKLEDIDRYENLWIVKRGGFFCMYFIQHCFGCRPAYSTVSEDAGIEPRTVATSALAVRCSNHSTRFIHATRLELIHNVMLMNSSFGEQGCFWLYSVQHITAYSCFWRDMGHFLRGTQVTAPYPLVISFEKIRETTAVPHGWSMTHSICFYTKNSHQSNLSV